MENVIHPSVAMLLVAPVSGGQLVTNGKRKTNRYKRKTSIQSVWAVGTLRAASDNTRSVHPLAPVSGGKEGLQKKHWMCFCAL